jgi:hypothetical protein
MDLTLVLDTGTLNTYWRCAEATSLAQAGQDCQRAACLATAVLGFLPATPQRLASIGGDPGPQTPLWHPDCSLCTETIRLAGPLVGAGEGHRSCFLPLLFFPGAADKAREISCTQANWHNWRRSWPIKPRC